MINSSTAINRFSGIVIISIIIIMNSRRSSRSTSNDISSGSRIVVSSIGSSSISSMSSIIISVSSVIITISNRISIIRINGTGIISIRRINMNSSSVSGRSTIRMSSAVAIRVSVCGVLVASFLLVWFSSLLLLMIL